MERVINQVSLENETMSVLGKNFPLEHVIGDHLSFVGDEEKLKNIGLVDAYKAL